MRPSFRFCSLIGGIVFMLRSQLLGVLEHRTPRHAAARPLPSATSGDASTPFFKVDGGGIEAAVRIHKNLSSSASFQFWFLSERLPVLSGR